MMSPQSECMHVNQNPHSKRPKRQVSFQDESEYYESDSYGGVSPRHKSSHDTFLVWVVWKRPANDELRRTCPLIGCEKSFDSQERMLQHIISCLQSSSGYYRCFRCKGAEKIGKYHIKHCSEVENHGGSFATICNRIRSAKKIFSPKSQGLKRHEFESYHSYGETSNSGEVVVSGPFELGDPRTRCSDNNFEMSSGADVHRPLELPSEQVAFGVYDLSGLQHQSSSSKQTPELDGESSYRQGQHWQNEGASRNDLFERNRWPSTHATEDSLSPCSPMSATEFNEWHSPTPISPLRDGGSNFRFSRFEASGRRQNSTDSLNWHGIVPERNNISPIKRWENQSWSETVNSDTSTTSGQFGLSYSTPGLSEGSSSRDASISSQFESPPGDDYSSKMLVDAPFCAEPDSYDFTSDSTDFDFNSVERVELAANEQKGLPSAEGFFHTARFPTNSQNSEYSQTHVQGEDSGFKSYQHSSPTTQFSSSPSNPSSPDSTPLRRTSRRPPRKDSCICGYEPGGIQKNRKGNLKRHRRACKVLKKHTDPESPPDLKPWLCDFPNCGKGFGRQDNLGAHQRLKKHTSTTKSMDFSPEVEWNDSLQELDGFEGFQGHSGWS